MAKIVIAMLGSWGDLFPYIGVGVELHRRDHDVVVACPPIFADLVTEAGLSFAPVGRSIGFEDFEERPEAFRPVLGFRHVIDEFLFDQIDQVTTDLVAAADGADLMLVHSINVAGFNVAEHLDIPVLTTTVFPGMIPSAHTVPGGLPVGPWDGRTGRLANQVMWVLGSAVMSAVFDRRVNRHRRSLGLEPVRNAWFGLPRRARGIVVMAPEALVGRPADWADSVVVTSFVSWDHGAHRPVPAETEQFLADGPPPVLITLGSSNAVRPEGFFELATRAVLDHGERALVVTGPAPASELPRPSDSAHVTTFAPFGAVAPRCRGAIHHAGLGTTVSVLTAGIPQVVVPRGFDQPDTAAALARIGVGINVPWARRRKRLEPAIDHLVTDADMAARAAATATRIGGVDGARATADAVERHVAAAPIAAAGARASRGVRAPAHV